MEFTGTDIVTQLLTGIAAVILLYIAMAMAEYLYKSFMHMWRDRVELFPDTYVSGAKMFTAIQNPNNPKSKMAQLSDNQRSGVEFSYSMFINLDSATFSSGTAKLHHIMHKGYGQFFPLMGPGVFCWGNKNTLRIYMNSYHTWNEYTEIDNIPVDNWFHLTISCKGTTVYIYINGNLKQKIKMSDNTPPYQNYGDVYLFSGRKKTIMQSSVTSLGDEESLTFDGAAKGMASRVFYFSYALTYSEIQALMNMGPSSKVNGANASVMTPYLSDTWWTTNGTQLSN